MNDRPLVFLDIETTGLSPFEARITEIGAIRVENNCITSTFQQLVNPQVPVPIFITQLTGIDDAMVSDAPFFGDILDELLEFLQGSVFIAHNVGFDYDFIKAECSRINHSFDIDRFCTARLSRRLYPQQRRHSLDTLIKAHNLQVKNRHRALDDATALFEFYKKAHLDHGERVSSVVTSIMLPCAPIAQ